MVLELDRSRVEGDSEIAAKSKEALSAFGEVSIKYSASVGAQTVLLEQRCRQGKIRLFKTASELLQFLLTNNLAQTIANEANRVHQEVNKQRLLKKKKPLVIGPQTAGSAAVTLEQELELAKMVTTFSDQELADLLRQAEQPTLGEVLQGLKISNLGTQIYSLFEQKQKKRESPPKISRFSDPDRDYY